MQFAQKSVAGQNGIAGNDNTWQKGEKSIMRHLKITKKTIVCGLVVIGVIIIPLLYSVLYLGAFWDPYAKLEELPVAVVNLDTGAEINGTVRNLGEELCDELQDASQLHFVFTSKSEALAGTKENEYYATIEIPRDFSASIASAGTTHKDVAAITFMANEKRNYLAAQILKSAVEQIKVSLTGKVDGEIVSQLCNQLAATPGKLDTLAAGMGSLSTGAGKLSDGTIQLSVGTGTLKNGAEAFSSNFGIYTNGVSSLETGSTELLEGVNALKQGVDTLATGAAALNDKTANIDSLRTSAELLASKTSEFNSGLAAYTQGVDSLISSAEQTSTFLKTYVAANPGLMADPAFSQFISAMSEPSNTQNLAVLKQYTLTLKTASAQLTTGTAQLSLATAGIPELKQGIEQLSAGLLAAQSGANQVASGTETLHGGLASLDTATSLFNHAGSTLAEGADQVDSGAIALANGMGSLKAGMDLAKTSVVSASTDAKTKLALLAGLDTYVEEPVVTQIDPLDPVPNYGTAFAPYFLSLSLWVGALIIFFAIYLDADGKFKLLSRNSDNKVLRSFAYLLIGLIQAVCLGVLLKVVLGLTIEHMLLYYVACCLVSLVFIAIVQFFLVFLKDIGKFLSIALLILQLTSCGGTFPMETVPKFFQVLYPFMPMTYSVGLFKEAISSTSDADALFNLLVLGGILAVFMTLTVIFSVARKTRIAAWDGQYVEGGMTTSAGKPMILVSTEDL